MKKLLLIALLFCFTQSKAQQNKQALPQQPFSVGCNNFDFENGTTSGWYIDGLVPLLNPTLNTPYLWGYPGTSPKDTLVTLNSTIGSQCSNGIDNYGGFPIVHPAGGLYALLLNNDSAGGKTEMAGFNQYFVVTPTNKSLTLRFAAVMQDGGHADTTKPHFSLYIKGSSGHNTYFAMQVIDTSFTGWQTSGIDPSVHYLPWTITTLDFSSLMNDSLVISFYVNDCNDGAHFGYAYIDGVCGNTFQITSSNALCTSGDSTTLIAPVGMASYSWSGPKSGTSQSLTTKIPGDYRLITTSVLHNYLPPDTLYYHLAIDSVVSSYIVNNICTYDTTNFIDQSSGSPNNWQWNFGDGTPLANSQNPTHAYSTAGTYTTTLIASNSCGATNTAHKTIVVYPLPVPLTKLVCYAPHVVLLCDSTDPYISFYWVGPDFYYSYGTEQCIQVSDTNNVYNGIYTLTVTDSNNCTSITNINVVVDTLPSVSFVLQKDTSQLSTWNAYPTYSSSTASAIWHWGDGTSTPGLYPSHTYSVAGKYNICVSAYNGNGCSVSVCQNDSVYRLSNSNMVYVNVINSTTGINQFSNTNTIKIYPNPANNKITIDANDIVDVKLFDVLGNQITSTKQNQIDVSNLPEGVYFIQVQTKQNTSTQKVIVQH